VNQFYKVTVTLAIKVKSWQQGLDHLLWKNHKNLAWQKIVSKVSFLGSIQGTASDISIAGSSGQGTTTALPDLARVASLFLVRSA